MAASTLHHLDCGTMCPLAGSLLGGPGHFWQRGELVCHCLLVESEEGLVLIESGLGSDDLGQHSRLPAGFRFMSKPPVDGPTALSHVRRLGFSPDDVRHIVLTHLDLDHAGGISDFPKAKVHVMRDEHKAAMTISKDDRERYLPTQWAHDVDWEIHSELDGEAWFGFGQVRPLTNLGDDLAIVPLPGHSAGHAAVAVRTDTGWLLHCGDAFFHRGDLLEPPEVPWGMRVFQRKVDKDRSLRQQNMNRLRELRVQRGSEVQILCSHDPVQLRELQGRSVAG